MLTVSVHKSDELRGADWWISTGDLAGCIASSPWPVGHDGHGIPQICVLFLDLTIII